MPAIRGSRAFWEGLVTASANPHRHAPLFYSHSQSPYRDAHVGGSSSMVLNRS